MYFNDFLTFLRNNDYINSELYDAILKWDRDEEWEAMSDFEKELEIKKYT